MTRAFFEELVLFLIPFAVFALYLLIGRRNPFTRQPWEGSSVWLAIAGLLIVIASFVYVGITAPRSSGAFVPTHMENGHVVPGQFK